MGGVGDLVCELLRDSVFHVCIIINQQHTAVGRLVGLSLSLFSPTRFLGK